MNATLRIITLTVLSVCSHNAFAQDAPLAVEIETVSVRPTSVHVNLTGTVEATNSVPVTFRSPGRLIEVTVDVGDRVEAGAILARVESTQAQSIVLAAQAQLAAAQAGLSQAELGQSRAADLLARGIGTVAEAQAAETSLLAARASYDQATAELDKANQALTDTAVMAPVAGVVVARQADIGEIAGTSEPVFTLAPDGAREVVLYAPNLPLLDGVMGRSFEVRPVGRAEPVAEVAVAEMSPIANRQTGTVLVKARLEQGDEQFALGTPVETTVSVPLTAAISLPWSALATDGGAPAVWRVDPSSHAVSLVPVEIARFTSSTVEIAAGLETGDLVVSAGSNLLYPGRVVAGEGLN